jgi:cytoskeletal protein CcmA (bactofilin family)
MGTNEREADEKNDGPVKRWWKPASVMRSFVKPEVVVPDEPAATANHAPDTRKETEMLKMGNRDEKEFGFDQGAGMAASVSGVKAGAGEGTSIGEHISIEGTIRADEDIVIDGSMKGTIEVKGHQLTVGVKGKVEADVTAESVVVSGKMTGNISARTKVQITKSADFSGQIKAKRIAVEDGAFIKATIELEREGEKPMQGTPQRPIEAVTMGSDPLKSVRPEAPKQQPIR